MADHAYRLTAEEAETTDDGGVVAKTAIPLHFHKVGQESAHIVERVRSIGVSGNQRSLPRIQFGVHLAAFGIELGLERGRFPFLPGVAAIGAKFAQPLDAIGEGRFKIQIGHQRGAWAVGAAGAVACAPPAPATIFPNASLSIAFSNAASAVMRPSLTNLARA